MRADRLIAALLVLQARGRITAAELAEELEVSERTARRDLEALAMSGVPVYSQAGRGGGWRLIGGARTDLTGLHADETRALFMALSQQGDTDPVLEAALRKLLVALPERFRDDAVVASNAIRVDPAGWGHVGAVHRPQAVTVLSHAVIEGHQCRIDYQRPNDDAPSERVVHPLGLVTKRGVWYLVANTDRGMRTFRVSRVHGVEPLDAAVERPEAFDLEREWERIVTDVAAWRPEVEARIRVDPAVVEPLRWVFRNRHVEHGVEDDGWFDLTVYEGSAQAMAAQLCGFGAGVRVVDAPTEVAEEFRRLAAELCDAWL